MVRHYTSNTNSILLLLLLSLILVSTQRCNAILRRLPVSPTATTTATSSFHIKYQQNHHQQQKEYQEEIHAVTLSLKGPHHGGCTNYNSAPSFTSSSAYTKPSLNAILKIPRGGKGHAQNDNPKTIRHLTMNRLYNVRGGRISTSATTTTSSSSSWFPIQKEELPQFLSMGTMMFLFIYVFTTTRDTKDTLVVSNCGAEAIPFLKLYGVMPCAVLFIMGYSKLSQVVGKQALFYCTLVPFFLFYAIFAFVLFPNRDLIHLNSGGGSGGNSIGSVAFSLVQYWSYSLYFIVTELWASAGVPLLFWQVANDVTPMHQAKRFYPLFAVVGNLAPIVSGKVMSYIVSHQKSADDVGFGSTLKQLATIKVGILFGIITLYNLVYSMAKERSRNELEEEIEEIVKSKGVRAIAKSVLTEDNKIQIKVEVTKKVKLATKSTPAKKVTLVESMKELAKSNELKAMATMVFCYNTCIELTEVLWKGILRKTYPNKSDYMAFMATFSQRVGVIALLLQLSASTIIQKLGWKWAASITPLIMVTLAIPFFFSIMLSKDTTSTTATAALSFATALSIGTWQNVASKVTKYSLFDPCKEMAYIPLGPEAKVKGKAAVDVLGARSGRSAGSAIQQILVASIGNGNILNCAPYLGAAYAITVGYWLKAVKVLSLLSHDEDVKNNNKNKGTKVHLE